MPVSYGLAGSAQRRDRLAEMKKYR